MKQGLFSDLTILWADDDPLLPRYAARMLGDAVGRLVTAADGEEAEDRFYECEPDIVLLDVDMPRQNGIRVAESIREKDPLVPIVMITGQDDKETMHQSLRCRIDDYLLKPVDPEALFRVLTRCAKRLDKVGGEYVFPDGSLYDPGTKVVLRNKQAVPLSRNEALFLELLIRNRDRIVPVADIHWELWAGEPVSESALKSVIARLRSKVGKKSIVNHSGVGYSLS